METATCMVKSRGCLILTVFRVTLTSLKLKLITATKFLSTGFTLIVSKSIMNGNEHKSTYQRNVIKRRLRVASSKSCFW